MHGSLETGSPARARSGRLRAGLLLALVLVLAAPAAALAAGPPPPVLPGEGGTVPGCGSAWLDWHQDSIVGTVGIHGQVTWCWDYYGVTWVEWGQSPFSNRWYAVTGWYGPMGAPSWCAGGRAADFQANFQLTAPIFGVASNAYLRERITVCPGGVISRINL